MQAFRGSGAPPAIFSASDWKSFPSVPPAIFTISAERKNAGPECVGASETPAPPDITRYAQCMVGLLNSEFVVRNWV
jgi:hypothetical protein